MNKTRILATVAAATITMTGLAMAAPESAIAAGNGCPANNFCIYNDTQRVNSTGLIFFENGTTMYNHRTTYYSSAELKQYDSAVVVNNTTGVFCTYNSGLQLLGRFGRGQTTIPAGTPYGHNFHVYYVKIC